MPIRIPTKPPVAAPTPAPVPAAPTPPAFSDANILLAIRQAAEANARKVITATIERGKDGLITRVRMEVEPV